MNKLDNFTKRFVAISLSIMGLILCSTLFVATISPANAGMSNAPTVLPPENGGGNIMMDYTSVHVPSQDKTYYECIVWNTVTGESKLYFYSYTDKKFKAYEDNVQLPRYPLD